MSFSSPFWLLALLALPPLLWLALRAVNPERASGPLHRLSPFRRAAFLFLRTSAIILLVLGLAGFGLARFSDRQAVVFLLDQSWSVTPGQLGRGLEVIEAVRGRLGRGDSASLVRFGADAELSEPAAGVPVGEGDGAVNGEATDIGSAIQLGLAQAGAVLHGTGSRANLRLVLLSDGNENRGSAERAAAVARSMGARIYPVPLDPRTGAAPEDAPEVSVEDVSAPARVRQDEPHEVTVLVRSRTRIRGSVTLLRDAAPVATREELFVPGENAVQFTGSFAQRGLHAWDALVEARGDGLAQNNHGRTVIEVSGPPQVLYVARPGKGSPSLLAALAAQGISAVRTDPARLPGSLAGYIPYDALILDNVPAYGMSNEKMETIARYVRDVGGGLLMTGGDASFGAGGYYKTPIERALPVDMDVKSPVEIPRLSLVILADRSGSMGGAVPSGEVKLDVVKSAALSAIESLNPFDTVGLLAFDASWEWTVPLTDAGQSETIAAELASLTPGGGTVMYPALEEVARVLGARASPLRHVIILSDGLTDEGDFEGLVKRMAREKITVSTVAVGEDADVKLLASMAGWGRGRAYATNDARDVPRIFMTETTIASQGLLIEKGFLPRQASAGDAVRGIPLESMPGLKGFVLTYMKPGAEMIASALYSAPLLATWRYGLGRSAAFTSDLGGRWSASWLAWDQFPRLAAQLVRWLERPSNADLLRPRLGVAGGRATVTVDAYDALGAFANGLDLAAIVLDPDGGRAEVRVPQTGPGLYQAVFPAAAVGDYIVTLSAATGDGSAPPAPVTLAATVPYSDEYRMLAADTALLDRLAALTGGGRIDAADDEEGLSALLHREPGMSAAGSDAWRYLLLTGLLLFFLDVVARRGTIPEGLRTRLAAGVKRLRRRDSLSYDELSVMVTRAREEERAKLRKRISGLSGKGSIDPELAAYLYIARLRSRKAAEESRKK
jgi:Ca-activated chloride channel homolog